MTLANDQQRMSALRRANTVRVNKKRVRLSCVAGERLVSELIACPPDCCGTAKIGEVVLWVPGIGCVKASRLLRKVPGLSPSTPLAGLTPDKRRGIGKLIAAFESDRAMRLGLSSALA